MRKMRANAGNAADMDIIHKKLPLGKHTKEAIAVIIYDTLLREDDYFPLSVRPLLVLILPVLSLFV